MTVSSRRLIPVCLFFSLALPGCASLSHREVATASGAVVGGVLGAVVTGGSTAGTVGGAAVGGLVGARLTGRAR